MNSFVNKFVKIDIKDQRITVSTIGIKLRHLLLMLNTLAIFSWSNLALSQPVSEIDRATSKWLDIESQINRLKVDWKTQEPLLKQRILLLNAEKQQLNQLLSRNNESGGDVDIKRKQLLTEQTHREEKQKIITKALQLLHFTTDEITSSLPPILADVWQQEKTSNTDNNTVLLQHSLAKLTKLAEFDQRVSIHEGTISTENEQKILVQQLFLGASTAWFVSRDGKYTGLGNVGQEGWKWHFDSSIEANEIQKAIDIFQKKQSADWVTLPIHLISSIESSVENNPSNLGETTSVNVSNQALMPIEKRQGVL